MRAMIKLWTVEVLPRTYTAQFWGKAPFRPSVSELGTGTPGHLRPHGSLLPSSTALGAAARSAHVTLVGAATTCTPDVLADVHTMQARPGSLEKARKVQLEPGFSLPAWMRLSAGADLSGGVGKADPDEEGSWKVSPVADV